MNKNTAQVQGVEALPGWMIGRAPLALRGIRFVEEGAGGNGGENPPAPAPAPAPSPAPTPTPPAPAPTPPAPKDNDSYDPAWARALREEAKGYRVDLEQTAATLATEKAAREAAEAKVAQYESEKAEQARVTSITTAAKDIANVDALLDSGSFSKVLEGVDINDAAKVTETVKAFVEANPHYAPAGTPAPRTNPQGVPSGGGTAAAPTSLHGAISAELASRQ